MGADAERLEYRHAEKCANDEIHDIVAELVSHSAPCAGKSEFLLVRKACFYAEPKIGNNQDEYERNHPS